VDKYVAMEWMRLMGMKLMKSDGAMSHDELCTMTCVTMSCVVTTSYNTTMSRRSLYQSHASPASNDWVNVDGLLPFSRYSVQVNASNTRGFLLSNVVTLNTPPAGTFSFSLFREVTFSRTGPVTLKIWTGPIRSGLGVVHSTS